MGIILKFIIKEIGCWRVDQDRVQCLAFVNTEMNFRVPLKKVYFDQLSDYQLLKQSLMQFIKYFLSV
jgi:hypothetical protein